MTTQEEFLATLRGRLVDGIPENPIRPLAPASEAPIGYAAELDDLEERFVEAATAAGAEVTGHPDHDLVTLLGTVGDTLRPKTAVVSADPECAGVADILEEQGVAILPNDDPQVIATADLGITGAITGIALTGSLVMASDRSRTRFASLLPETHLALLPRNRILATPGDLFRHLPDHLPNGLPSNLVLITGPSRSADIELQLTLGVHGPRRVLIALRGG